MELLILNVETLVSVFLMSGGNDSTHLRAARNKVFSYSLFELFEPGRAWLG